MNFTTQEKKRREPEEFNKNINLFKYFNLKL